MFLADEFLQRNKKIAEYAVTMAEYLGIGIFNDVEKVYSFMLLYNRHFINIDLKNEDEVMKAIDKAKSTFGNLFNHAKRRVFSLNKNREYDYNQKILDVLHLSILHFDRDGNFISIERKIEELKEIFGDDSEIVKMFYELSKEYSQYEKKTEKEIVMHFSDTLSKKEEKSILEVTCRANIDEDDFNNLVLYVMGSRGYLDVKSIGVVIERFFMTKDLQFNTLSVRKITKDEAVEVVNKENENRFYFSYDVVSRTYKEESVYNIVYKTVEADRVLFVVTKPLVIDGPLTYSYYLKNNEEIFSCVPTTNICNYASNYVFGLLVPHFVKNDMETLIKKLEN